MMLKTDADAPCGDSRSSFLRLANESLDCLERKLGPIEEWRGSGRNDDWKQSIGQQLKACEGESDLQELLIKLPIITQDLRMLEAAPPSGDIHSSFDSRASPSGSPAIPAGSSRA